MRACARIRTGGGDGGRKELKVKNSEREWKGHFLREIARHEY